MSSIDGQFAVLTGASSGIGASMARALAACNVRLLLTGRNTERLEALQRELCTLTSEVRYCSVDLLTSGGIDRLHAEVTDMGASVDILIHSAGCLSAAPLAHVDADEITRLMQVNYHAPAMLTQRFLPMLADAPLGQILFVNSSAVQRGIAGLAAYSASKHALKGLADSLREEVNPFGIRVVSLYPGQTATPMQETLHADRDIDYVPEALMQPADVAAIAVSALCLNPSVEITDLYLRPMDRPNKSAKEMVAPDSWDFS